MMKDRPRLITLLAYLNIFEGILCGLLYLFVIISNGISTIFDISIMSRILLMIYLFLPVIISYGLLKGKIWGWLGEVSLFAVIILQCILEIYYLLLDDNIKNSDEISWLGALLGLVISFFVIKYLFNKRIRSYFNVHFGRAEVGQ